MNLRKFLLAITVSLLSVWAVDGPAKNKCVPEIYVFGLSASFNDSTVYMSDVQTLKNAWVADKTKFLINRENYSYQLKNYMESKGLPHRTCMIIYSLKRKDAEKKYKKIKNKYTKRGNIDIKYLTDANFHFTTIDNSEDEVTQDKKDVDKKKDKKGKNKKERPAKPFNPQDGPGRPM